MAIPARRGPQAVPLPHGSQHPRVLLL